MLKRRFVISSVAAGVAVLATTAIVIAAWTVSGSGSGAGAATIAQSLGVTPVVPTGTAANLYPGGPAGTVYFSVTNPNPFAVTITNVTWGTPLSGNPTSCANSNITLDAAAPTTVSISIPANDTSGVTVGVPGVLDLSHSAPNGCEGQSFTISMTITGAQQ